MKLQLSLCRGINCSTRQERKLLCFKGKRGMHEEKNSWIFVSFTTTLRKVHLNHSRLLLFFLQEEKKKTRERDFIIPASTAIRCCNYCLAQEGLPSSLSQNKTFFHSLCVFLSLYLLSRWKKRFLSTEDGNDLTRKKCNLIHAKRWLFPTVFIFLVCLSFLSSFEFIF